MFKNTINMKNILFYCFISAIICGCNTGQDSQVSLEQSLVDRSIEASGGDLYTQSTISFKFRDRNYIGTRKGGFFRLERLWSDSLNSYRDYISNEGYSRFQNESAVEVVDSMAFKYSNSINSVFYFGLLPYGLNDPAVIKTYIDTVEINGQQYDKVKITFHQEGGGKDFEDEFVYWFNKETGHFDYMGYNYQTDGGGARFRVAYNPRTVNGIRFQDYINYKPKDSTFMDVSQFDQLYLNNGVEELSRIELEQINVTINK